MEGKVELGAGWGNSFPQEKFLRPRMIVESGGGHLGCPRILLPP